MIVEYRTRFLSGKKLAQSLRELVEELDQPSRLGGLLVTEGLDAGQGVVE